MIPEPRLLRPFNFGPSEHFCLHRQLPDFLGGSCTCTPVGCLHSNKGPWNDPDVMKVFP